MSSGEWQTDTDIRDTARRAVEAAGRVISSHRDRIEQIGHKGEIDLVTEVDLLSEKTILAMIGQAFPGHRIVAEEGGEQQVDSDYVWWVDPLDGTTNFAHGYPHYAVSVALQYRNEIVLGFVYDPLREELFSAARGEGAFLNGERLGVSRTARLEESLLATGFPYAIEEHPRALSFLTRILSRVQGIRRDGSAALNLAYTAAGRLDGFWEIGLKPWDTAAGLLLVEEAGGIVSDLAGGDFSIHRREIVSANPRLHPLLIRILQG